MTDGYDLTRYAFVLLGIRGAAVYEPLGNQTVVPIGRGPVARTAVESAKGWIRAAPPTAR